MTELTKRGVPVKIPWGSEEQEAFDHLKFLLCQPADVPLAIINCQKSYKLYVDASYYAVAAVPTQMDDGGRDRHVAFPSIKLSTAQCSEAMVEKEAYAAVWDGDFKSLGDGYFGVL